MIKKIWNDTTKGPSGKYSRKSLTALASFAMACGLGIADMFNCCEVNIDIFYGLLTLGGGTLILTVIDKLKGKSPFNEEKG